MLRPEISNSTCTRTQNKIFRLITSDYNCDTSPKILQHFNIPDVLQRRDYFNGIQVYGCIHDIAPMSKLLHLNSEYNSYITRHVDDNAFYVLGIG